MTDNVNKYCPKCAKYNKVDPQTSARACYGISFDNGEFPANSKAHCFRTTLKKSAVERQVAYKQASYKMSTLLNLLSVGGFGFCGSCGRHIKGTEDWSCELCGSGNTVFKNN